MADDPQGPAPALSVVGLTAREIGAIAAEAGLTLWELSPSAGSLEDAYLALTRDSLDYQDRSEHDLPTDTVEQELAS